MPRTIALLLAFASLGIVPLLHPLPASAQTLNLGAPQPPSMGQDAAALALASQLRKDADAIDPATPGAPARRAARLLAAALLEAGQREAESTTRTTAQRGSVRILLARSLAARLPTIDVALEAGRLDPPTTAILAADLARLEAEADHDIDLIEGGLRLALAPLTALDDGAEDGSRPVRAPLGGWVPPDDQLDMSAYRSMISALTASGTPLSTPSIDALRALDQLADRAHAERAFRRTATSIRRALLAAGALTGHPTGLPRWIGPTARTVVEPAFERGLATLSDPGRRAQGLEDLRRHGRLLRLIARTDQLPDDQAGRRARESLSNYLAAPPSNRELESQLLSAYERALDLALAPGNLPDERTLARPLRPAYREFIDAARVASDRLADALPTFLNDSQAMTDPGILALINAANQAMDEARGLSEITALLTGQAEQPPGVEPVPLDNYRDLATRLVTMSQVAARAGGSPSGEGAAAKRELGAFALDVAAWRVLPAEDDLRAAVAAPDPAWAAATEGREHDLLDLVDRTRNAYLANVAADGTLVERAALRARMQLLADLLTTVREVVTTQRMLDAPIVADGADADSESAGNSPAGGPATLNEWPGWELSRQAHRLLVEGLIDALSETVSLALRGEDERARTRIAAMRQDMAGALLPARLHLRWMAVAPASVGTLDDLALGSPGPDAWMPLPRELAAEFCRIAEELPGIRIGRDDAQDRAVRAYLVLLAQDALAEMR